MSVEISKNYCQYIVLPPNSAPRGDLFSIPIYIISSIFTLLTVKNNALLKNKQHPITCRNQFTQLECKNSSDIDFFESCKLICRY